MVVRPPLRPLPEHEIQRIKAELQAIGFAAVLLPVGVSVAGMATCGLEDDEGE